MKLKNRHVFECHAALLALANPPQPKDQPRLVYKLSGSTQHSLSRNIRKLADEIDLHLEATRRDLVLKYELNGYNPEKDSGDVVKRGKFELFNREWNKILDSEENEVDLPLTPIKVSALNLEVNPIPLTVLAGIEWLLVNDCAAE